MFGNECEPCQHCQQCKQRIARRYLHLWWYYLVLLLNCDHGEKVIYSVLPPALKFDCNVSPQQMCLSSKAGMRRRDATRGTFLVKHLSRGFLRVHSVYPVKAVFAMFTVCNLHCVQCSLCAICTVCVDPNSAFLTSGCSPIPLTPFQLFYGQSTLFTSPAAIGLFCRKIDCCSKSHNSNMLHISICA